MGLLDSLYGQGDYANSGMLLPFAITPEGERVFSFPAPVQAAARTVGRAMGDLPIDIDPCLLYTSPSPRDRTRSRMPSSA